MTAPATAHTEPRCSASLDCRLPPGPVEMVARGIEAGGVEKESRAEQSRGRSRTDSRRTSYRFRRVSAFLLDHCCLDRRECFLFLQAADAHRHGGQSTTRRARWRGGRNAAQHETRSQMCGGRGGCTGRCLGRAHLRVSPVGRPHNGVAAAVSSGACEHIVVGLHCKVFARVPQVERAGGFRAQSRTCVRRQHVVKRPP